MLVEGMARPKRAFLIHAAAEDDDRAEVLAFAGVECRILFFQRTHQLRSDERTAKQVGECETRQHEQANPSETSDRLRPEDQQDQETYEQKEPRVRVDEILDELVEAEPEGRQFHSPPFY